MKNAENCNVNVVVVAVICAWIRDIREAWLKRSDPVLNSAWQRVRDICKMNLTGDRWQTTDGGRPVKKAGKSVAWQSVTRWEQREKMRQAAHTARLFGDTWGGNENAQGTRKRDHLRGRKAHDRGTAEPWSRPSENRELRTHLVCPVSGHPIREGSGFRVCGEAAVGYALSPRPTLASRGHLATRVKRSPAQHHHREASTRPSISPLVTRVYVAPRHNTHNSRHRHHGQFRQQAYRSATRLSISTTTNAAARRPFWASLRGALQADDAKLPLFCECATSAHRPGPQRSLTC